MESYLKEQVQAALEIDNVKNAIFLCERLYACTSSEDNAYLLAKCYVRNRQPYRAVHLLKPRGGALQPRGQLLLAQATFEREDYVEAERVVTQALESSDADKYVRAELHYLNGMICRRTNRTEPARAHFAQALNCNSLHWQALEELCKFGKTGEAKRYFEKLSRCVKAGLEPEEEPLEEASDAPAEAEGTADVEMEGVEETTRSTQRPTTSSRSKRTSSRAPSLPNRTRAAAPHTPPSRIRPVFEESVRTRGATNRPVTRRSTKLAADNTTTTITSRRRPALRSTPDRPVGKLQRVEDPAGPAPDKNDDVHGSDTVYYSAEDAPSDGTSAPKRPLATSGENEDAMSITLDCENPLEHQGAGSGGMEQTHSLFYLLGKALYALSNYNHDLALQIFTKKLPRNQAESVWVITKLGCLHMQRANYEEAQKMFMQARTTDPTHFEDMDLYSSMLYLMDDAPQLSHLANELRNYDRVIPETWCVVGNLHSLLREHSSALAAFQRAIQLDSHRSYSFSLCGHTYLEMEDFEKASKCFGTAVSLDGRHQSGWYGQGMVHFLKQEYTQAASDFKRAVKINPSHSVFRLRYGVALARLGRSKEAIEEFETATTLDKHNKDAFLQKGKLYYEMHEYELAKAAFSAASSVAHLDAEVHYHLGLACKKLGDTHNATDAFYRALDLNPGSIIKANIRAALDKINQPDDDQLRKY